MAKAKVLVQNSQAMKPDSARWSTAAAIKYAERKSVTRDPHIVQIPSRQSKLIDLGHICINITCNFKMADSVAVLASGFLLTLFWGKCISFYREKQRLFCPQMFFHCVLFRALFVENLNC